MATAHKVKAATTDEELRQQAYNLIAGRDLSADKDIKKDGKYWSEIKKRAITVLTERGTPENLGIVETVEAVMKSYRATNQPTQ
ncbi:hypothetical protein D3C87_715440 [compost metagenome]|jgi:hypothetical protein